MRAAYITELGPADAIRVGELPVPAIGPTDVLVRVEVVAVDPVDTMVRSGAYPTPTPFPFVVGRDLVGTVAVAPPGAAGFAPGDRVWCNSLGHGGRQGSFAGYAPVPAERLYHLPAAVDPVAEVVDYRDPDLYGRLRTLAPDGVDLYVDTSGHLDLPAAVDLLATRGRLVLLAGGGQRLTLPVGPLYTHGRRILGFVISRADTGELAEAAAVLNRRLVAEELPVRVHDIWPLDRAAEAHQAIERGLRGRLVLRVAPP